MSEEKKTPTKETKTKTEPTKKVTKPAKKAEPKAAKKVEKVEAKVAETQKTEAPKTEAPKEKKPMDPKKKKRIIIWSCVIGGVLIAGIVTAILIIMLTKVDYKESYEIATKLEDPMSDFYKNYNYCNYAVEYVDDDYPSEESFSEYIADCKKAISIDTIDLVKKLGETSGIAKDNDLKTLYNQFNELFAKAIGNANADSIKNLDIYDSWHKFMYKSDSFSIKYYTNTSELVDKVANYAINSGNDTLKSFGETWKTKASDLLETIKSYKNGDIRYSEYDSKVDEFDDWYEKNVPKVSELLPFNFDGDKYDVDEAWEILESAIKIKSGNEANNSSVLNNYNDYYNDDSSDSDINLEDILKLME